MQSQFITTELEHTYQQEFTTEDTSDVYEAYVDMYCI